MTTKSQLSAQLGMAEQRIAQLERALRFYARRQRWCSIDSGDDNMARRWLIGDNDDGPGYGVAQRALKKEDT